MERSWRQVELVEVVPSRGGFTRGVSEMPRQSIANRGDDGFNHMSSIHSTIFVLCLSDCFTSKEDLLTSLIHTCVSTFLIPRSA